MKLNKKTQVALLIIKHLIKKYNALKDSGKLPIVSSGQFERQFEIPYTTISKVANALSVAGILKSVHGASGGYYISNYNKVMDLTFVEIDSIVHKRKDNTNKIYEQIAIDYFQCTLEKVTVKDWLRYHVINRI